MTPDLEHVLVERVIRSADRILLRYHESWAGRPTLCVRTWSEADEPLPGLRLLTGRANREEPVAVG
jgi:hypothetical protein